MPEMTGGEVVTRALRALGVEHVFGIVSVHNIPIYDAIERVGGITPVSVRHEQGAVHSADGYARATGKLGVAITSTGPGAANAVPGLYEAGFASSPVLMITGQVESRHYGKGKGFLHEAERQIDMLRSVTRRAESVRRRDEIAATIVHVANDARTGRPQPCAVEIPIDFQYAKGPGSIPRVKAPAPVKPPPDALGEAAALLSDSERPLIWAGGGVLAAGASAALSKLAEKLQSPVLTSVAGRGAIPEDHHLCLGALSAHPALAATVAEADVVLAVGTRFQAGSTRQWRLPIPGKLVHLDADPAVIGRSYEPAIGIVGDAQLGLQALSKLVRRSRADGGYLARAQDARETARATMRQQIGADHEAVMDTMRDLLPRDANVVRDSTVPAYLWGDRLFPILEPRTSMHPTGAAIGPALPLAIGAAIGSGRKTVVIQGDGGLMLSIGELATAVQYHVPIVVCVFNDCGYGVIRAIQARTFEGRQTGVDLATPDFAAVALAMGMHGERVAGTDEFRDAFKRAVDAEGPVLLDIDMGALAPMPGFAPPRRPS